MLFRGSKKKIFFLSLSLTVIVGLFLFFGFVSAQSTTLNFGLSYGQETGLAGADIRLIIARIIRAVLGILGILALGIMLWGGYIIMTSAGNEEKVQQGKKILMNGTIGLVIILSAFAIAQFVINQLAGATGFGADETNKKCEDPAYLAEHKNECVPGWCGEDPKGCCLEEMKLEGLFVAQSITPSTKDTKMNNVAGRAIFNMPISNQFSAEQVIQILKIIDKLTNKSEDYTSKFDFVFLKDKNGKNMGVEARYKPDSGLCLDGKTGCIDNGDYRIDVNENLTSVTGKQISKGTEQCPFPMQAEFGVKHDNKEEQVMNFDGKDDYINLGGNPLQDGSMTVEAWIYPTSDSSEGKPIIAVNSEQYTLIQYNKNLKFRLAGVHPPGGEGYCDAIAYTAVEMNKWQHVVATYDAVTMRQRIYVNGKTVGWENLAKQQDACKTISGGGYKLKIGMQEVSQGEIVNKYFVGKMSDVCLYNSYFDAGMVQSSYERGRGHCGQAVQDGLKGAWHLNSGYGNQVVNLVNPGKNDGLLIGMQKWSSEPVLMVTSSQYLSFDGTDASVEVDSAATADFKDKFSIALWVRVDGDNSDGWSDHIIDKHQGGVPGSGYIIYYQKSPSRIVVDMRRGVGDAVSLVQPVSIGKWYHVAVTYDGQISKMYLDGWLQKTQDKGSVKPIISYNGKLWIGGDHSGDVKNRFKGSVGEVHFYDRVLSWDEINVLASQKIGPYLNMSENNQLIAGYRFDEGGGTIIKDFSAGGNHTAKIIGTGYSWAPGLSKAKVLDKTPPNVGNLLIKGQDKIEKVITGILNPITSAIIDNSGIGYGRIEIERTGANDEKTVEVDYFDGPSVTPGSDATPEKPYVYQYPWVPSKVAEGSAVYKITLNVWDIDHNQTTVSTTVVAVPGHCTNGVQDEGETGIDIGGTCSGGEGDFCIVDSQCECGKCVKNKCVSQPKILDVLPMDGAAGNWITILGKCFGKTAGKVEFSKDDQWKQADLVDCGDDKTWNDSWVIIKVPSDADIPVGTSSTIRLTRTDSKGNLLSDSTTNEFGPKPGPNKDGLFSKTDIKRPGLCSVKAQIKVNEVMMLINQGYPGIDATAKGSGFGKDGFIYFGGQSDPKTYLLTGGIQAKTSMWTDNLIDTKVPNNMSIGTVSVYVTSGGQPSNGVPFTVISQKDLMDKIPVIDSIDPATSTVKSYITITGHGFGNEKRAVYLADNKEDAIKCAAQDLAECVELNLDLPAICGDGTWTDTQVIAEVTATTSVKSYFLILKNSFNLHSSGEDKFSVIPGPPKPSICKLEPSSGPAPRPSGDYLHLYGANFSDKASEDMVYFWWQKAVPDDINKWLKSLNEIQTVSESEIVTAIPIDKMTGSSMKTGPIRVGVKKDGGEILSNGVKYTVEDCRYASEALKTELDASGLRCCDNDGADLGLWKPKTFVCDGEKRDSGYVWRFTTGKIRALPHVLEECNEVDWNKVGVPIDFPSPVPSTLWKKGKEACVNATVAVKFNVKMDKEILKGPGIIEIFKCGGGSLSADCKEYKEELKDWVIDTDTDDVVKIIPPVGQKTLEKNTWYHVELSDKIKSRDCSEVTQEVGSLSKCFSDPIQITKPCGKGTAYCFDFKTGTEMCTLKDASILPLQYTTNFLGQILDPSYPFNSQPLHPYYYLVWGRGSQECTVLDVDGMGWKWDSDNENKAITAVAPSTAEEISIKKVKYTDSRATVTAKEDTYGDPVFITASAAGLKVLKTVNMLAGLTKPFKITTTTDIKTFDSLPDDGFVSLDSYKLRVSFSNLAELSTSTEQFSYFDVFKCWYLDRYIFEKAGLLQIFIKEKQCADGTKERMFHFVDKTYGDAIVIDTFSFNSGNPSLWSFGEYEIEKKDDKITLTNLKNGDKTDAPLINKNPKEPIGHTAIGGSSENKHPFFGNIDKLELEKSDTINQSYKATSTLYIDVYPPTVIDYWPNCAEACISASIGAQFSRRMFTPSYDFPNENMILWKCADENCGVDELILMDNWFVDDADVNTGLSTDQILRMNMDNKFEMLATSTWYLVKVIGGKDGVYGLGKANVKSTDESAKGKPMKEDFVWKFRTREDDSPCKADKVDIEPDPFMATLIGQKTKYSAFPKAFVGNCGGPQGQELNPWQYGWEWGVGDDLVADVTHFKSSTSSNQFCLDNCTLRGSDISLGQEAPYMCGNGELEPGEDCDIGVAMEKVGISCGLNCLRPGNISTTTCGNGDVEIALGEECDPKKNKFCSNTCLWEGSSTMLPAINTTTIPWCGSGKATEGEECDLKIFSTSTNYSAVGCSNKCLHLGTSLSQIWCDKNGEDYPECEKAISVCGNGKVESGEECERFGQTMIKLAGKGDVPVLVWDNEKRCTDSCLLGDICDAMLMQQTDFYCNKDDKNVEGCSKNCTWAGSSLIYSEPSMCSDGVVGIGEYEQCEAESGATMMNGENPVQSVKAIGLGDVNPVTKSQTTTIEAVVSAYYSGKTKNFVDLQEQAKTKGAGDYTLKCGNTEYQIPKEIGGWHKKYNDCLDSKLIIGDTEYTTFGVADDSCCRQRAYRNEEYPKDGAGISLVDEDGNIEPVCRNTYIAVKFANRFIDEKTLPGNFVIAVGHKDSKYKCWENQEIDVTDLVDKTFAMKVGQPENGGGFWQKLWGWFKGWLANLTSDTVFAENPDPEEIKVWCSGSYTAEPVLTYDWSKDLKNVTTTVALYLNKLLPQESTVAVILQGGQDGIKDTQGVGIRNPDPFKPELADAWFFGTGKDICKLSDVYVDPESWLFNKPNTTNTFKALVKSKTEQLLVPIKGQYDWKIDWQPQGNQIFDIPKEVIDPGVTTAVVIGARNVEGNVIAVANALITTDVYLEDNQLGKTFTGVTNLTADFCENPWPPPSFFPFEDGIGFGKTVNVSGFNATGTFNGTSLLPAGDEYFNFSMNYCADAGQSGTKLDDLPYLRPMMFLPSVGVGTGNCQINTTQTCKGDAECPPYYLMPLSGSPTLKFQDGCSLEQTTDELLNNGCLLYTFPSGKYCKKGKLYPPEYFPPELGSAYRACETDQDCFWPWGETCQTMPMIDHDFVKENLCKKAPVLSGDTLKRYVFTNYDNDDVIGIQIFGNSERLSAGKWVKQKFPSISGMNPSSVADYEAVTDSKNYYINALNQTKFGVTTDLWNRIYLFSINKDAQQSTNEVFTQLMGSLKFNINISDEGYCLLNNVEATKLPFGNEQAKISGRACADDFDCRDATGLPFVDTNGVCSNAKTKLKRDIARLTDYQKIQNQIKKYQESNKQAPDMKSGSYLSGYTVSKWPSWGKLGSIVGSLPTDKVNKWAGCNAKADQLTCWDTVSSTFYCPNYMQAFEYEFVSSTKSYMLHGPLEYIDLGMSFTQSYINKDLLSTDPWCAPTQSHNQAEGMCGNGVVNQGEECDPVGQSAVSDEGFISSAKGKCHADKYPGITWGKDACAVDLDCGYYVSSANQIVHASQPSACTFVGKLVVGTTKTLVGAKEKMEALGCSDHGECKLWNNYNEIGPTVEIGGEILSIFDLQQKPASGFQCSNLSSLGYQDTSALKCVGAGVPIYGKCPDNTQAIKVCSGACKWEKSKCNPVYYCGNGIIEPGEDCDDGGLNGAYGHCKAGCQSGYSEAYCGNGYIDGDKDKDGVKDAGENWIEFCDKKETKYNKGFCQSLPTKSCGADNECWIPMGTVVPIGCKAEKQCSEGFCVNGFNCGSCLSKDDPQYDFLKDNTCSWDCQSRGEYCGDKKVNSQYEECDDGNLNNIDFCDSQCGELNVTCRDSANFSTSTTSTVIDVYSNFWWGGGKQKEASCVDINKSNKNLENTGTEICKAYGLVCFKTEEAYYINYGMDKAWKLSGIKCGDDLSFLGNSDELKGLRIVCQGVYTGPAPAETADEESQEKTKQYCGNGVVDEMYKDEKGKDVKEICDMGPNNGLACSPPYGKSCSYCSSDCKEVLKVDAKAFCGNNKFDYTNTQGEIYETERCENINNSVHVLNSFNPLEPLSKIKSCTDKGEIICLDCLKDPIDKCVTCGFPLVGTEAQLLVANVTNPPKWPGTKTSFTWWDIQLQLGAPVFLLYKDDKFNSYGVSNLPNNKITMPGSVNSNSICNPPGSSYVVQFTENAATASSTKADQSFDYQVHNEKKDTPVVNEYAISPPLEKEGQFRVVVRWTSKAKNIGFRGVVHNSGFAEVGEMNPVVYDSVAESGALCKGFLLDSQCPNSSYSSVYVHPAGNLDSTYMQATTIDTNKWQYLTNYAFTVSQYSVGDKGMKQLAQDSSVKGDLIVELYTYHEGYNKFTIYIPDKVFKIADAKLLGDNSAQYWHVFNLVYNTNTKQYEVVAVNQTTQDDTQVAKNTPNSGFTAGGYMQLKNSGDASKFFWDGSKITTLNFGDIVAVFETRNNIEQHHITILNNNTKLTPATNNCQFLEPTENNPQPTNVLNCKNLFAANLNFANEYDIADLYQTEEGEVASFKDRLVYFNHTKVDNSLYRYIIKFMKLVDEDAEEYEYVPAKIKGDVLQDQNDQRQFLVYLGGGDSQNKFMLNIGYPLILDKTDYSNIGEEATEWYLFNVKRDANSVYVKIVNKFLPPNQNYQVFD